MTQKTWYSLLIITAILGAWWIWLSRPAPDETTGGKIPAPQRGFAAPDFELMDSSGASYRLSSLRGKPLLINFWASWCSPCRSEMPAMEQAFRQYQDQGFLVLAVNAANQDSRENAAAFSQQLGLSFPILFDETGSVSELYQVRALPTSFFVDPDGTIQEVIIGGPMAEALLAIRIQNLLEGNQ